MFAPITAFAVATLLAPATAGSPSHLSAHVDNPWFPLKPGTVFRYAGTTDGVATKDIVNVTSKTHRVPGGLARVVHDRVYQHGRQIEDTLDWYAEDRGGTVWYMGEATKEFDAHRRVVSREGSWEAGVKGGQGGVFMPAHPRVGQSFRQEYYKDHAEDHFKIVSIKNGVMTTHEWSRLEPGVLDGKVYRRATGQIREESIRGGREFLHLVSVKRG